MLSIYNEDPELDVARLHGIIGQKDVDIESYLVSYDIIREETMLAYTKTYRRLMHRSRIYMSSYTRLRGKWEKRR